MSAPAPWFELPVTPALVQWRIVDAKGRVALPWRASYDVRASLPSASYHEIYTDDTQQNRPDRPGNYRFVLARGFDAAALTPGEYAVQVVALDTHGNSGRSSWPLVVSRRPAARSKCAYIAGVRGRCAGSFASARRDTRAGSSPSSGRSSRGSGGSSSRCAKATSRAVPVNGGPPGQALEHDTAQCVQVGRRGRLAASLQQFQAEYAACRRAVPTA